MDRQSKTNRESLWRLPLPCDDDREREPIHIIYQTAEDGIDDREYYSKETIQWEIKAGNRAGTVEQMDANVETMARDLQEILRIGAEQKRLWEVYEGR